MKGVPSTQSVLEVKPKTSKYGYNPDETGVFVAGHLWESPLTLLMGTGEMLVKMLAARAVPIPIQFLTDFVFEMADDRVFVGVGQNVFDD